jgi:hypothetical protein
VTPLPLPREGNDLIVDDVMLGSGAAQQYRELPAQHEVHFVGLFVPLHVLEAREPERGDRLIGLARWQFHRVHSGMTYDFELTLPLHHLRHASAGSGQLSKSKVDLFGTDTRGCEVHRLDAHAPL